MCVGVRAGNNHNGNNDDVDLHDTFPRMPRIVPRATIGIRPRLTTSCNCIAFVLYLWVDGEREGSSEHVST